MTTEELNTLIAKAEAGDVAAMNQLGLIYGQDEYKDLSKAFYWISKSAETGDILGMANLGGWCYLWGNGTEKNIPLAIEWLEKAAEKGSVWSMNRLTHIFGNVEGYTNYEHAAKWFLELIKRDCIPSSGWSDENSGYNKDLYEKIKNAILNSTTEEEMMSAMSGGNGNSLLGGAISFTTSNAKSYINQAEAAIQRNIEYKEEQRRKAEEEAARKRAEEERARREAEERALREREEEERREREKREQERREREERERHERLAREAEERARKEAAERINAKKVSDEIDAIGEMVYTQECRGKILAARSSYEALSRKAKSYVTNIDKLQTVEQAYEEVDKAEQNRIEQRKIREAIEKGVGTRKYKKYFHDAYVIPEGTQRIGDGAFAECSKLTSIKIPDSVTSIGDNAFHLCVNLKSVKIPSSVSSIGKDAFGGCHSLKSIVVPDSVKTIGESAFQQCTNLATAKLPNSIVVIESGTFWRCSSLKDFTIPTSVTAIGELALGYCESLESITIPSNVTSIGDGVFSCCYGLKRITVPVGMKQNKNIMGWGANITIIKEDPSLNEKQTIGKQVTHDEKTIRTSGASKPKKKGGLFSSILEYVYK